jgi:ribosome-binding protein aMBF1 (putative translation factor)
MIRYISKIIEFFGYDPEPEPAMLSERIVIVYARPRLGFTQDDLAKEVKPDSASIWRWEKLALNRQEKLRKLQQFNNGQ